MEIENIKNFVYNHSERIFSSKQLRLIPMVLLYIIILGSFLSVDTGNSVYIWVIRVLFIPYLVWFVFKSKKTYANRLLLQGSSMLILSAFFLMMSFVFIDSLERNVVAYKYCIILSMLLFLIVYAMIRVSTLKKASSRQQSESKKGATLLWLYAGISTLGIGIARSKLSEMSQELVDKVCIFLSAGLSIILLLGIDNLLKYYFCRKYKIDIE